MWTRENLSIALNQQIHNDSKFNDIIIDSKKVKINDIFIGLNGNNCNGSIFAQEAIQNGASLCISNIPLNFTDINSNKYIIVNDTYKDGLLRLAEYKRIHHNATYIGITGSAGKTTTKEMLKLAINDSYANYGNFNNHYGLPLSLSNMNNSKYGIFELGMSNFGEIAFLSKILRPNIAIITNIAPAHIQFFQSTIDIAKAKSEIINALLKDDFLILNLDMLHANIIFKTAKNRGIKIIGFSMKNNTKYQKSLHKFIVVKNTNIININNELHTQVVVEYNNNYIEYKIPYVGIDLVYNSLAVLSTIIACDLNIKFINNLVNFTIPDRRNKIHHIKSLNIQLIDDSYNSNPTSLAYALQKVNYYSQHTQYKNKVVILGDMLELGHLSEQYHTKIKNHIIANDINSVICIGENMYYLYKALNIKNKAYFKNVSTAIQQDIYQFIIPNITVVLVKGSNAMNMNVICNTILDNQ